MASTDTETLSSLHPEDQLESWKEIAAYLGRDVRTVQRWEKSEGLPVHRHLHEKQGSVYAFRGEIDGWRAGRDVAALRDAGEEPNGAATSEPAPRGEEATPTSARQARKLPTMLAVVLLLLASGAFLGWLVLREKHTPQSHGPAMIAVLPFDNLSGDPAQEYFSDGMTEELIVQIGRLHADGLDAIAVGSTMAFKRSAKPLAEIARQLGVSYVVQGAVRRSGDRVRVSAHLIRAVDDAHLWDESYDRDLRDVLALQSEVAEAIAGGISVNLGRTAHPARSVDPLAYEAYLKGRNFWNKRTPEDLTRAIAEFQQATRIDPDYSPAYVGLADSYELLGSAEMGVLPPREAMPLARQAATRALDLDPQLAEAHASLAHIKLIYDWDFGGAEKEFQRAIALNPAYATAHQWYALLLNAQGRTAAALAELKRAQELDPLSPAVRSAVSEAFYFARQYDRAEAEARRALELDGDFVLGLLNLGRAQEQQGRLEEAIATFERASSLTGHGPAMSMFVAHARAAKGDVRGGREILAYLLRLRRDNRVYVPPLYLASLYAALDDRARAFAQLQQALDERCEYLIYLDRDPMADGLRSDPRFARLLQQASLPAAR
ncbi:MAG TPA: tetratricopeptide repeat protein [Terriglobales bacterium]|nr:tetratricopeptide repeat protein [Terriglobales bacterium]